jgi:hypothetical protein
MNSFKVVALVLIVAGNLGLAYGGFAHTKETHQAKIGPFAMPVNEKQTINVPDWAGIGAIVLGGGLLLVGGRKSQTSAQKMLRRLHGEYRNLG